MYSRRDFLKSTALQFTGLGLAGLSLPTFSGNVLRAATGVSKSSRRFQIERIERVTVKVPFRAAPQRAMDRELPHWRYAEIFEIELNSGAVGFGETMLYYTWRRTGDAEVKRALGSNAAELMWDDSLGAGLQIALFDAVARTADVPVHRLLGHQVHESTPLSWWNIDMAVDDLVSESQEAYRLGYMSFKTKGRPWFDLWNQVESVCKVVPPEFKFDMDFNDTLRDADRAIPILKELEQHPQVDIYESPIPQGDIEGNRRIRDATRVHIAMHYGTPRPADVVKEGVCDGFVVGGGATRVMQQGHFSEEVNMPFWLQLVGTGITAAFSLHFGGVLKAATWPAVNCHQLYTHSMLTEEVRPEKGYAKVPQKPGLGFELDRNAIERFRVDMPEDRPNPARIIEVSWPDGLKMYLADGGVNFVLRTANEGKMPFYVRGVDTRLYPNDGTAAWRELYEKALKGPVTVKP